MEKKKFTPFTKENNPFTKRKGKDAPPPKKGKGK